MKSRGEIEAVVDTLLTRYGVIEVPVPIERLANLEGLPIIESGFTSPAISGALVKGEKINGILVNSGHHDNRKRFTIAHELGHHILSHQAKEEHVDWQFTVIRRDGKSSEASDVDEMEANFFAASILMPKRLLRKDIDSLISFNGEPDLKDEEIAKLARRYRVSATAMGYRLINLGYLSPI